MRILLRRDWTSALRLIAWVVFCTLAGCTGQQVVDHAFGFDAVSDSPDVYVLDYRYGDSKHPGAKGVDESQIGRRPPQGTGIHGPMRRGDSLYVKWQVKSTGRVYEDTVDLRSRLPKDIKDHRIYFVIKGEQLYIYLISPDRRPPGMPPNGPDMYQHRIVKTIYPDQP